MKHPVKLTLLLVSVLTAGCAVGPDYVRPGMATSAAYKEAAGDIAWKGASPQDMLPANAWWTMYGDAGLDLLEQQAAAANQNIHIAEAHFRQAQALSASTQAAFFPSLTSSPAASRSQRSLDTGLTSNGAIIKSNSIDLSASWEVDMWGRVRRTAESGDANLAASAADLSAAILSVQAMLAQSYFQLRVLDTQQKLFNDTTDVYERSLKLTRNRYAVGLAARFDVAQAETQFKSTRALSIDNHLQRSQLEHAIAVLAGQEPAAFSLSAMPFEQLIKLPGIPAGVPSQLLERRPDIAAAERRVAAANAAIGVAKAAYFPALTLAASGSYQSSQFANLFSVPSRAWSLGPQLALSVFDGGLRRAQTQAAIATFDAGVATYKGVVLTAFQEVEDNLTASGLLEQEAAEQDGATRFARDALDQTINRYQAGTIDYLSVVTVQNTALTNERASLALLGRRLAASIGLIKSLGGASIATAPDK